MRKTLTVFLLAIMLFVAGTPCFASGKAEKKKVLSAILNKIDLRFKTMDKHLKSTAAEIEKVKNKNEEIRLALASLCRALPFSIDCSFIGADGIMKIVEPRAYSKFEGTDISRQEQIRKLHHEKKPVFSKVFLSVEKVYSVDVEYPVFSGKNKLMGSVSVLLKPEMFLGDIFEHYLKNTPYKFSVLQVDGLCIFDRHNDLIGKNFLSDPQLKKSPGLLKATKEIIGKKEGFDLFDVDLPGVGDNLKEEVFWNTVEMYGTQWRVVLIVHLEEMEKKQ